MKAGISEHETDPTKVRADLAEKFNVLNEVFQYAKNRLRMGTYRYGVSTHDEYDYRQKLNEKLAAYDETGNKEFLVDAANYCVLEYGWPLRTDTYFKAVDRNESWELE